MLRLADVLTLDLFASSVWLRNLIFLRQFKSGPEHANNNREQPAVIFKLFHDDMILTNVLKFLEHGC